MALKKLLLGAALSTGALIGFASSASAYVVCNGEGDCWHTESHYRYPGTGYTYHPDDWYFHQTFGRGSRAPLARLSRGPRLLSRRRLDHASDPAESLSTVRSGGSHGPPFFYSANISSDATPAAFASFAAVSAESGRYARSEIIVRRGRSPTGTPAFFAHWVGARRRRRMKARGGRSQLLLAAPHQASPHHAGAQPIGMTAAGMTRSARTARAATSRGAA